MHSCLLCRSSLSVPHAAAGHGHTATRPPRKTTPATSLDKSPATDAGESSAPRRASRTRQRHRPQRPRAGFSACWLVSVSAVSGTRGAVPARVRVRACVLDSYGAPAARWRSGSCDRRPEGERGARGTRPWIGERACRGCRGRERRQ
jgi:hypothetical protein